jgi:hypothetical protein
MRGRIARGVDDIDTELDALNPVNPWLCGPQNFGGNVEATRLTPVFNTSQDEVGTSGLFRIDARTFVDGSTLGYVWLEGEWLDTALDIACEREHVWTREHQFVNSNSR